MNEHEKINHVELPATDIEATKAFFKAAFGWTFEDFGPDYTAFSNQGLDGGGVHIRSIGDDGKRQRAHRVLQR